MRRSAVAVQEGMDVNELELGDAAHEDQMDLPFAVQPLHQFRYQDRYLVSRRWRVDRLACGGIDDIILDLAVFPGRRRAIPHSFHQPLVDLADQPLRDRCAAGQVLRDEIKRPSVVQKLPHIVGVGFRDRFAGHQAFGLVEGQLRARLGFPRSSQTSARPRNHHRGPLAKRVAELERENQRLRNQTALPTVAWINRPASEYLELHF